MINMPLVCKIQNAYTGTSTVNVVTSGTNKPIEDIKSINPVSLGKTIDIVGGNLSYFEVQEIEYYLMLSKGTQRFNWSGVHYQLEDGYTVNVVANRPTISATFRRVR